MNYQRILSGVLFIVVIGIVFWKSPLSIGLKVKCGSKSNDGPMLLEASDQLLSFRSDDQAALRQAVDIKLKVAKDEMIDVDRIVNEMISKNPDDPGLLLIRARIHVMRGHFDHALDDLSQAKEFALRGTSSKEFAPSPALIDEMIEHVRKESKRPNPTP